jgi:hypothetical protein
VKLVKEFEVNGQKFLIQCHPFAEGAVIAFQLNRDLRSHVIESQKATMRALDDLTPEQTKRLEDAKDNDERTKIWIEIVAPKISKEDLAQSAVNFLRSINPKEMVSLFSEMAKYTKSADGKPLGEVLTYKTMIPLMAAIIEQNDFLDLDASELLQIQA